MFTFVVYLSLGIFVVLTVLTFIHYMKLIDKNQNIDKKQHIRFSRINEIFNLVKVHTYPKLGLIFPKMELTLSVRDYMVKKASTKQLLATLKYFEADGKTISAVYAKGKDLIRGTMHDCEKYMLNKGFIRIHKNYLVNYRFIESLDIEDSVVRLTGGEELPLNSNMSSKIIKQIQMLTKNL